MLGRAFGYDFTVVRGKQLGRKLDSPTISQIFLCDRDRGFRVGMDTRAQSLHRREPLFRAQERKQPHFHPGAVEIAGKATDEKFQIYSLLFPSFVLS